MFEVSVSHATKTKFKTPFLPELLKELLTHHNPFAFRGDFFQYHSSVLIAFILMNSHISINTNITSALHQGIERAASTGYYHGSLTLLSLKAIVSGGY